MWEKVGVVRNGADLEQAVGELAELPLPRPKT